MDTYIAFMDRDPSRVIRRRRRDARLAIGAVGMLLATVMCVVGPNLSLLAPTVPGNDVTSEMPS